MLRKYRLPKWIRLLLGLFLLVLVLGILLAADIYAYSFASDPGVADAAIVLGTEAWNTQPSPVFRERINHAVDLYKAGRVKYLIFTGGAGKNEPVAEALVGRDYAIQNGVAATDTLYETRSTVTFENLCGSREIIERERLGRVLIVSDPLHMRRSMTIARDLGMDAFPSPTPTTRYVSLGTKLPFLLEETRVYAGYLIRRVFERPEQRCARGLGLATSVAATQSPTVVKNHRLLHLETR